MPSYRAEKILTPACLVYFLVCTAGFLCGLWSGFIYVPPGGSPHSAAPLPVLQCLAAAQVMFFMLFYPVVVAGRNDNGILPSAVEVLVFSMMTVPLYYAASFFSDALAADCARSWLVVLAVWPLGLAAGRMMKGGKGGWAGLTGMTALCLGLPMVYYVLLEFCPGLNPEPVFRLAPVTFAWSASCPQAEGNVLPAVIWPPVAWLSLAVFVKLVTFSK